MNYDEIKRYLINFTEITKTILNFKIGGINISVGLILFIILLVLIILQIIRFLKFRVLTVVKRFAAQKNIKILDLLVQQIQKIGNPFYISAALYIVGQYIRELNGVSKSFFYPLFVLVCGYYAVGFLKEVISWFIKASLGAPKDEDGDGIEEKADEAFLQMAQTFGGIIAYIIVFITVAQILNWNISSIVGVLGVSSIAIAFAVQNILGDIFAAFTIYIDQPFKPGDQIILSEFTGTVKKIGLKSTRISLLDGDELIVSNRDLTSARVRNLRKIRARRVAVDLFLDGQTKLEKIKKAREIIVNAVTQNELARLKRINLLKLSGLGREIQYVYLIEDENYETFTQVQEDINFKILEGFEKEKINISEKH
ncbi:MAG: mechanosensitive ion channel family protein [Patescibacteria group bacterium]